MVSTLSSAMTTDSRTLVEVKHKEHAWSLWMMNITFDTEYSNPIDIEANTITKN